MNQDEKILNQLKAWGREEPSEDFVVVSRRNMERMVRMSQVEESPLVGWGYKLALALALVVLMVGGFRVMEVAADEAAPGDVLYPVDQMAEKVRLWLARHPNKRRVVLRRMLEERVEEMEVADETGVVSLGEKVDELLRQPEMSDLHQLRELYLELKADGIDQAERQRLRKSVKEVLKDRPVLRRRVKGIIDSRLKRRK